MTSKEEAFLQYYVANGMNSRKKADLYRLAFGKQVEDKKDSSLETYAKRILASSEAKEYIKKHRPNNVVRSEYLLDAIKDLNELAERKFAEGKSREFSELKKEVRLHLADLAKCIDVVEAGKTEEFKITDFKFSLTIPLSAGKKAIQDTCNYVNGLLDGRSPRLLLINNGELKELDFFGVNEDLSSENVREALARENFGLAIPSQS